MSHKISVIAAGALSVIAQGLLILPFDMVGSSLRLPDWGSVTLGVTLFSIATIWIVSTIRALNAGWRGNAHFILNQAIIVIGIFLISDSSESLTRLGGFLLTSLITALTVYGIIANTTSPSLTGIIESDTVEKRKEALHLLDQMQNAEALREQAAIANQKLTAEKQRTTQLTLLMELSQQLNDDIDPPVAAQLAVNTLERAINCTVVSLMMYEADKQELVALASSGRMTNIIPPGHRQGADIGLHGRVMQLKKTIIVNDTSLEPEFIPIDNENTQSLIIVPMIARGQVMGTLEVRSDTANAFQKTDIAGVEGIASELTYAWERTKNNQRLTDLIQSGISLTTLLDPQAAVQEIAVLAKKTFEAQFVYVTLVDQQNEFRRTAHAGNAPRLFKSLNENLTGQPLMQAALNATKPFRVRDLRKYTNPKGFDIDDPNLRGVLAIPIRLHGLSIGTILAFGKREALFFSESDESLADLLGAQAAASVESSWLYQELRNKEGMTSMLRQLSEEVMIMDDLRKAAETFARAAHKATNATETGIVLINPQGEIETEVEMDSKGFHTRQNHPMDRIHQVIQMSQSMHVSIEKGELACYPLLARSHPIGAIWMRIPEVRGQNFANLQLLVNQAAVSLERVNLLVESRRQAREIVAAYEKLERTYDQTLKALMSALDARDRETEGHSMRVSRLACLLGEKIGLSEKQLKALERGALLHDIGKIGISDTILHKPGKLNDDEWKIMRMHPNIGARIVERIPFLQESLSVVLYHHERWDGSGYPHGVRGRDIPIHARIFAVVDVFDALTSNRRYREKSTPEDAIRYLREHADILFDTEIVETLAQLPYADFIEGGKLP